MRSYVFKLPDIGEGTAEAELVAWRVNIGDEVQEDQPLADVMTDKATVEISSPNAGIVIALHGEVGGSIAVGSPLVEFIIADNEAPPPDLAISRNPPKIVAQSADFILQTVHVATGRFVFKLPDIGEGTAEAELVAWHVKVGDDVKEDQPLADVMTDKATVEITSPSAGRVIKLHGEVGEAILVGSALVEFETAGGPSASEKSIGADVDPPIKSAVEVASLRRDRPHSSPAVRRRARELGVALADIKGTGPNGRIRQLDLENYLASRLVAAAGTSKEGGAHDIVIADAASQDFTETKLIGLRRKIAEKMEISTRRIPHFAYVETVDVTELEKIRGSLNARYNGTRPKLSLLPFLIRAMIRLLPDFPQINATFDEESGIIRKYQAVHLGVATQTDNGLMVPVIRNAQARGLWELAAEVARLALAARNGSATRNELSGSTITITSLGTLGGIATTPVINHPEVAIIGPNRIEERPVAIDGKLAFRKMMNISSSFDHRIVDGYDAARFIQELKSIVEEPTLLLV